MITTSRPMVVVELVEGAGGQTFDLSELEDFCHTIREQGGSDKTQISYGQSGLHMRAETVWSGAQQ